MLQTGVSHAMHTANTHIEEHKEYSRAHAVQKNVVVGAAGAIAVGALLTGANAYNALQQHESAPLNKTSAHS
jgi:hypothetical protein